MTLKIGIISTADIARKLCDAMHKSGVAIPFAVGSRDLAKAKEFAAVNKVTKAYGSYDEVIADPEVQAIYVPLPTVFRTEYCIKAANAGKAVLCDKPILNASDAKEIVAACEKNNVHFMDCTMWMHHKRTLLVKSLLQSPASPIGTLCRVNASFSINILAKPGNIRWNASVEPYGCIGDLAWYCARAILWVYDYELPISVTAQSTFKENCPIDCSALFEFKNEKFASLDCSFRNNRRQYLEIVGDKGCIIIPDFVLPFNAEPFWIPQNTFNAVAEYRIQDYYGQVTSHQVEECVQVVEMIRTFVKDMESKKKGEAVSQEWGKMSIHTQTVLDAIYKSSKEKSVVVLE